jgi:hypothetical protein
VATRYIDAENIVYTDKNISDLMVGVINSQKDKNTMTSSTDKILSLNPLSLIFLSGLAMQLFIASCCNDPETGYTHSPVLKNNTDMRMNRWQTCFYAYCISIFQQYSFEIEKKIFESPDKLTPYYVHSMLLLNYSRAILLFISNNNISKNSAAKVDQWFQLIINLKKSSLFRKFPQTNSDALALLTGDHSKYKNKYTNDGVEFVHFSPNTLYIRSMSIVIIHQTHYDSPKTFTEWTRFNALHLTDLLQIDKYSSQFENIIINSKCIDKFPYIHYLDCKALYNSWTRVAQKNSAVPVVKIFKQILMQIHSRMELFHDYQREKRKSVDQEEEFNCDEVNCDVFEHCIKEIEKKIKKEEEKTKNCEKFKKNYEANKQTNNKQTKMLEETHLETHLHPIPKFWTCQFLFPLPMMNWENIPEEQRFAC